MIKGRLAPYILVSFLIHTGLLIGAHRFLKLPAEELEPADHIPVEVVVLREESPALQPGLTPGEKISTKKALETKSQVLTYAETDQHTDDITEPVPKAGNYEPRMTVDIVPTLGVGAGVREGEESAGRPMDSSSQTIPLHISAVKPLPPTEPSPFEMKMPAVLVAAKAEMIPPYPPTPTKVATLLRSSQSAAELVFELQPIAMENNYTPRLNVDNVATLGSIPVTREGETAAGKPIILASQMPPLQLSPVDPASPAEASTLEEKFPTILVEAKADLGPAHSQTPKKFETPLASRRPRDDPYPELHPIPQEDKYEPRLMVSTLQVNSRPSGAQVYVDGMPTGETPTDMELPVGKHEVRLSLPDYYDLKAQIELIERHQTLPIFFRLLPVE